MERKAGGQTDRQDKRTERHTDRHAHGEADTNRQIERQPDRQTIYKQSINTQYTQYYSVHLITFRHTQSGGNQSNTMAVVPPCPSVAAVGGKTAA